MAESSDARFQRIEDQLQSLPGLITAVQQLTDQVSTMVQDRTSANHDGDHHVRRPHRDPEREYHPPTRLTKMDFPSFQRSDIDGWIQKCERYFDLDGTPDNWKVRLASVHLDERAYIWHQAFEEDEQGRPIAWAEYKRALKIRFGSAYESPMADFKRLRHDGSLEEYDDEFDHLRRKLRLSEEHSVQAYIEGLRDDFGRQVRLQRPRTMLEARRIAKIYEFNSRDGADGKYPSKRGQRDTSPSQDRWRPNKTPFKAGSQLAGSRSSTWSRPTPGVSKTGSSATVSSRSRATSSSPPVQFRHSHRMTPEEVEEHHTKNLCFYCHSPYSRDHHCAQRQRMELHLLELETEDAEPPDPDDEDTVGHAEACPDASECFQISLHAIQGRVGAVSMRIQGYIGRRPIHILIDNGATHDYMDCALARKLGWKTSDKPVAEVEVAGGTRLHIFGLWKNLKWKMQGREFQWDFRIMDITTYDLVLGLNWL